jgi:hypothetical protein
MTGVKLFKEGDLVSMDPPQYGYKEGEVCHVTRNGNLQVMPRRAIGGKWTPAQTWKLWVNISKVDVKLI